MRVLFAVFALLLFVETVSSDVAIRRGQRMNDPSDSRFLKKEEKNDDNDNNNNNNNNNDKNDKNNDNKNNDNKNNDNKNNDNNNNNNNQDAPTDEPASLTGIDNCPVYCAANPQIEDCEKECEKANEKREEGGANQRAFTNFMERCVRKLTKKCNRIIKATPPGQKIPKRCRNNPLHGPRCLKKWQKQGN